MTRPLAALALAALLGACAPLADDSPGPVRVLLAGDSTMAPKLPERRPETGWGEMLQAWFDPADAVVSNHARNGRSTRTFLSEGRWDALLAETRPGDTVFIQFGHNDQSEHKVERYTPPDQFKANLLRFVADVRAREATPVLLTPAVRRRFDEAGAFFDSHGEYPGLVRQAAAESGAALIDMEASSRRLLVEYGPERSKSLFLWLAPGENPNYPDGIEDNTHFSPPGARAMAALVVQDLAGSGLELAARLRAEQAASASD